MLNLDQTAAFLGISRLTLDRWIRQGLLADAGKRVGHFEREALTRWARRHGIRVRAVPQKRAQAAPDPLADAIARGAVGCAQAVGDARSAIEAALSALGLPGAVHAKILAEVLERERLASTALGHGVAIPHPRQHPIGLIEQARVSVLFIDPAIDWAAVDGKRVHTAFLVLAPHTQEHLRLLSRIAFALRHPGFGELLLKRPAHEELVEHLRRIVKDG